MGCEKGGCHDTQKTAANEDAHEQPCSARSTVPVAACPFSGRGLYKRSKLSPSRAGESFGGWPQLYSTLDPLKAVSPLACLVYRQLYSSTTPQEFGLCSTFLYNYCCTARAPSTC